MFRQTSRQRIDWLQILLQQRIIAQIIDLWLKEIKAAAFRFDLSPEDIGCTGMHLTSHERHVEPGNVQRFSVRTNFSCHNPEILEIADGQGCLHVPFYSYDRPVVSDRERGKLHRIFHFIICPGIIPDEITDRADACLLINGCTLRPDSFDLCDGRCLLHMLTLLSSFPQKEDTGLSPVSSLEKRSSGASGHVL